MGVTDILEHYDDFFVVVLKGYFRNSKCLKFHYGVDIFYVIILFLFLSILESSAPLRGASF